MNNNVLRYVLIAASALSISLAHADEQFAKLYGYFPDDGVVLGQGWDLLRGEKKDKICREGTKVAIKNNETKSDYSLVFDAEQVSQKMNMSANVAYGGLGYSASMSYAASQSNFSDRSKTYIMGDITTNKGGEYLLVDNAKGRIDRNECGDGYVSAIIYGGQLSIIYEISKNFLEFSKEMKIDASAGGFGSSVSVSFSQSLMNNLKSDSTKIKMYQKSGDQTLPLVQEDVIKKIGQFSTFPPQEAMPYKVVVTRYRDADTAVNFRLIRAYYFSYLRMVDLLNTYESAIEQPLLYYLPFQENDNSLSEASGSLRSTVQCMGAVLNSCFNDSSNCLFDEKGFKDSKNDKELLSKICPNISNGQTPVSRGLLSMILFTQVKDTDSRLFSPSLKNDTANSLPSPSVTFYKLYAASPLPRHVKMADGTNAKLTPDTGDFFNDLTIYCSRFYQDCKPNPGDYPPDVLKALIRSWVLNVKLAPVASALCNISFENPFCLSAAELLELMPTPEKIKVDKSANFNFEPTPAPAQVPQPTPRMREPLDECIRHGPHFCSISR